MAENWFGIWDTVNETWVGGWKYTLQSAMDFIDEQEFPENLEIREVDPTILYE